MDKFLGSSWGFPQKALQDACSQIVLPAGFSYLVYGLEFEESLECLQNLGLVKVEEATREIRLQTQKSVATSFLGKHAVGAFDVALRVLHHLFPGREMADFEGFKNVFERAGPLFCHVIAVLDRFDGRLMSVDATLKFYELLQRAFW